MKRILSILTIQAAIFAAAAMAADISGTWKGTADNQGGTIERTFVFKVDGSKLTGETTSEMMGKSVITDGKIDGDNISFTITANFQGSDMKLDYKGKVSGDTIKLSVEFPGGGPSIEWTLKKA
jgi:hypothetical protein